MMVESSGARPLPLRAWDRWQSPPVGRGIRGLVMACAALLVLDSAGTIRFGFTSLTPSYVLLGLACVLGFPWIIKGYARLPRAIAWSAGALLATYAASLVFNHQVGVPGLARAGPERGIVYLADLMLGLSAVGLIVGLWAKESVRGLVLAAALGGGLAGLYGVYQWFALRLGLPLSDVNNTLDSNGITSGGSQGAGLFGGERIRGTFLEPHFLAGYLSSVIPIGCLAVLLLRSRWRALACLGLVAMLFALLLTISAPGWAALAIPVPIAAVLWAVGRGWKAPAAAAGAIAVVVLIATPTVLAAPRVLEPVLGRSSNDLTYSTSFRTETWKSAVDLWTEKPALGSGPGQSAVRLAIAGLSGLGVKNSSALISAQGIWAAALLDGGVVAFALWGLLLGLILFVIGRNVVRHPVPFTAAAMAAAAAVTIEVLISGDRLFPRAWVLVGVALATSYASLRTPGDLAEGVDSEAVTEPTEGTTVVVDALAARFGGTAQVVIAVSRLLAIDSRVDRLIVVATEGTVIARELNETRGLELVSVPATGRTGLLRRVLWEAVRLPRLVNQANASVLITLSGMLPRHPDCPIVCELLNSVPLHKPRGLGARARRAAIRRTGRYAAVVHAPTTAQAELLKPLLGDKVRVVPHGIDRSLFTPAPSPGADVLFVADFHAHKRHDIALAAWALLPEPRPRLRFIGDPGTDSACYERVEAQAHELDSDRILIEPRVSQDQLPAAYHAARLVVLPSEFESFGMPIAEALSCGVPAVVRDVPALRETAGGGALFLTGDDPADWSRALARLLDDDDTHGQLSRAGLRHAARYTWADTVEEILDAAHSGEAGPKQRR